jgi:hypothetical protein
MRWIATSRDNLQCLHCILNLRNWKKNCVKKKLTKFNQFNSSEIYMSVQDCIQLHCPITTENLYIFFKRHIGLLFKWPRCHGCSEEKINHNSEKQKTNKSYKTEAQFNPSQKLRMDLLVRNNEATAFMSTTNGDVVTISDFISQLGIS